MTTVKIYTEKTTPRVKLNITTKQKQGQPPKKKKKDFKPQEKVKVIPEEVRTKAGAARVVARRFSELVLLEVSEVFVKFR